MRQVECPIEAMSRVRLEQKERKISRERMWLLVELISESCQLRMGKKAARFSRKDSCGSV